MLHRNAAQAGEDGLAGRSGSPPIKMPADGTRRRPKT